MDIRTTYDIGQSVFIAWVERVVEKRPCPACGGRGHLNATAEDGSQHEVPCPNKSRYTDSEAVRPTRCYRGEIDVGYRHILTSVKEMTVGQVRIEVGGISGNTNVGGGAWNQTMERKEQVMCYETGIGSGNLWDVELHPVRLGQSANWAIFPTREEAERWASRTVAELDTLLAVELAWEEAKEEDCIREIALQDALNGED